MRPALPRCALLLAAIALAAPAAAAAQCDPQPDWGPIDAAQAREVVVLVNEHRQSLDPPAQPLAISRSLTRSATWKSRHMSHYDYFEHDDQAPPVARTPGQRAQACGYPTDVGENIAYNYFTPESVMQAWLSSPGHRANIEDSRYTAIGVGESNRYWTQNFGFVEHEPNLAPRAVDDAATAMRGELQVDVLANDSDEDIDWAYVDAVDQPANGSTAKTADARAVTYTPKAGFAGTDTFTYTLIDLAGERSTATVTVEIAGPNRRPRAVADVVRLKRATKRKLIAAARNDRDPDGDRVRVTKIVKAPKRGSAKIKRGRIEYRPLNGRVRRDSLTYRVSDGQGGTDTARVRIRPRRG